MPLWQYSYDVVRAPALNLLFFRHLQYMIEIVQHNSAQELISTAGAHLEQRESEHNHFLGIVYALARDIGAYGPQPPYLMSILQDSSVIGAALITPPRRVLMTRIEGVLPEVVQHLITYLQQADAPVPGVAGPIAEARAFTDAWLAEHRNQSATTFMQMRVFEARNVSEVPISPGLLRLAQPDDLPLIAQWLGAFSTDVGEPTSQHDSETAAERHISESAMYIWQDEHPVSMAKAARGTGHGTTITAVYTPPEFRKRGYATSCMYCLTKKLVSENYRVCTLYTDLTNPTSNSIYPKVGYVPVGDSVAVNFAASS